MSQISGPVSSVAQTALTQKDQAARQDGARETSERATARQQRLKSENREFVETMAEAAGLKVNPDSSHDADARRRKRFTLMGHQEPAAEKDAEADEQNRAHAAALLADPDHRDGPTPPPCIIDVEA